MEIKDKNKVIFLAGVLIFLFLLQFFFIPTFKKTKKLNQRLANAKEELSEIRKLGKSYLSEKSYLNLTKEKDFSFYSLVEKFAIDCGVKGKMVSLRPVSAPISSNYKTVGIELRLEKVDLKELTQFLTEIENSSHPICLNRLSIEMDKSGLLKATVEIVTVQEIPQDVIASPPMFTGARGNLVLSLREARCLVCHCEAEGRGNLDFVARVFAFTTILCYNDQ